ncbi:hypothetical protein [uncultured Sulfurimonas sp.]|nr:hypothetical protein [Sulfurimonas sp.]
MALWAKFPDNCDYNPELVDTINHGHVKFILPYEKHLLTTLFRNNF